MLQYIRLVRPFNCLMALLAALVGGAVSAGLGTFLAADVYLAALAAVLIAGAGSAANDLADAEADSVGRPRRPLPSGKVRRTAATGFSAALFLVGILLSGLINTLAFAITVLVSALMLLYSFRIQGRVLSGSAVLSLLMASAFLFGGVSAASGSSQLLAPILLFAFAFLVGLPRQLLKGLDDSEGEGAGLFKRLKSRTVEKLGLSDAGAGRLPVLVAEASFLLAVAVSALPYALGLFGAEYAAVAVVADILLLLALGMLTVSEKRSGMVGRARSLFFGKRLYRSVSSYSRIGFLLGVLAFLAGAVF